MDLLKVALAVMAVIFAYLFAVTFAPMPEAGSEQAKTIVPFLLGSGIGTVIGFYWGNADQKKEGK